MAEWQPFSTDTMVAPSGEFAENKLLFHPYSPDGTCILCIVQTCLAEVCGLYLTSALTGTCSTMIGSTSRSDQVIMVPL